MDTIIYLSYAKINETGDCGACGYDLREHKIQDYHLIKVLIKEKVPEMGKERKRPLDIWRVGKRLQYRRSLRQHEKQRRSMEVKLKLELAACLEDRDEVYLCFDETVSRDSWVRSILPFQEFDAYLTKDWVYRLMEEARHPHFVVLGDVPYSKELLWRFAPYMKSLVWIAPDRAAEEELEEFAEEFYQETGLAIRLQFLPADMTYGQLVIPQYVSKEAVNIVDLTEGKHIPRFEPPKGSIWLCCAGDLDKERRIEARRLSCNVISVRKQWKNAPFA